MMASVAWSSVSDWHKAFRNSYYDRFDTHVFSLSAIFTAMLGVNTLCLQLVHISLYGISRSLTIVFNVMFGYLVLKKKTSITVCLSLLIVIVGFLVGTRYVFFSRCRVVFY